MTALQSRGEYVSEVRYGTVRYGTVRYGTVRYGTVRYGTVRTFKPISSGHDPREERANEYNPECDRRVVHVVDCDRCVLGEAERYDHEGCPSNRYDPHRDRVFSKTEFCRLE